MEDWKNDPRLKNLDPAKLAFLTDFAETIASLPRSQLLPAFFQLQSEAAQKNICFSDQETELFVSILTLHMPQEERRKLETLRLLAKKLAARSS